MASHTHWRDSQAWRSQGLPMNTTSNQACKLFDATLTQYVGWYDDNGVGGLEKSCNDMVIADPDFVMGHVLKNGLDLMGTGTTMRLDNAFGKALYDMAILADKQTKVLTEREKLHVKAVRWWADDQMTQAADIWEEILVDHPTDMLALKFAHDNYFYLGYGPQMRDSIGRVIGKWDKSIPLYGYLYGMYSFGLEETNLFPKAEKIARKGLEINPRDAWSTHSMAHVCEMMGRQDEGIKFMSDTESDWSTCEMLSCHNYWHWALYMIEKGDYEGALGIYDAHIIKRAKASGAALDTVDACSMLNRLEMEGASVGDRWNNIFEVVKPHIDDHITSFNDNHILLACLGAKNKEVSDAMMTSIKTYVESQRGTNHDITKQVGLPICEALVAYDNQEYDKTVDILYPLRYNIWKIGGSNAQRDMYNLVLIHAAMKSSQPEHQKLASCLLAERKANKEDSPMTDRLMMKASAQHVP